MTVVDLTTAPLPAPAGLLDGLPRRLGLTLPELRRAAELAGGAPLPFPDPGGPGPAGAAGDLLGDRLGGADGSADPAETAYDVALRALPDPTDSLVRRGLLAAGSLDAGLAGALGLLATPRLAVDLDLAVGDDRLRSWQRQRADAVATLATADGLVFELAWCHTSQWAGELARVATLLPDDDRAAPEGTSGTRPPDVVRLPFELADAAAEAVAAGRPDVLPALLDQAPRVTDAAGRPLAASDAHRALTWLTSHCRGRLRALATDVTPRAGLPVATLSWLLTDDGWRALEPVPGAAGMLQVRRVDPADLAASLAPALAGVAS